MPLTRDFKDIIKARAERDPEFRVGLFREAVEAMLCEDLETGKVLLRDYVNATVARLKQREGVSLSLNIIPTNNSSKNSSGSASGNLS